MSMLADEGLVITSKVMFRYMTNSRIRRRMRTMSGFFGEHADYFGYGVYTGRKQPIQAGRGESEDADRFPPTHLTRGLGCP